MRVSDDPSSESLHLYGEIVREISLSGEELQDWFGDYARQQRSRIACDLDIISRLLGRDQRILELGSMPFITTIALRRLGYDVRGVDIHPERFRKTIEGSGITVDACDIERNALPYEDRSFDSVIFFEIFEHLRINPVFTLSEAYRVLKPGGSFLFTTPNLKSLTGMYDLLVRDRTGADPFKEYAKLEEIGHMGHVRLYTAAEVASLLESVGFKVNGVFFRGRYNSKMMRLLTGFVPSLKPMIMVSASR
ncbi:MAG: class I SAM-dependent methyltransferase [Thermodesulfobacteriota bacterium]|nr:MAG: class I SAM-dependent methyltransferase [Thermodesulfobacteriota bacterium]